jgi:hypothetical protein
MDGAVALMRAAEKGGHPEKCPAESESGRAPLWQREVTLSGKLGLHVENCGKEGNDQLWRIN